MQCETYVIIHSSGSGEVRCDRGGTCWLLVLGVCRPARAAWAVARRRRRACVGSGEDDMWRVRQGESESLTEEGCFYCFRVTWGEG